MDSKHRHELQTNDLGKLTDKVGQTLDKNANQILGVVCVASLILAGVIYWVRTTNAQQSAAWTDIASHRTADDLKEVAERYDGTSAAAWAKLQEGERRLAEGIPLMFTDRESGVKELGKAKGAFESLVNRTGVAAVVRERALFGLARCLESQSDGEKTLGDAIAKYESLVKEFPDSPHKEIAEKRVVLLKSDGAKEFYAWFSKENPKPLPPAKPSDGKLPSLDDDLPELPKSLRPRPTGEDEPAVEDKPAESSEKKPVKPIPVDDEKPAADKDDASEKKKPASDDKEAKPSDDKPAEAKPDKTNP
ncbi:MAG: hypothetical protein HZA46_12610 [Planctomycetales bacterium]|nr:hypothetical protein [Planctomycetales bacterium]